MIPVLFMVVQNFQLKKIACGMQRKQNVSIKQKPNGDKECDNRLLQ